MNTRTISSLVFVEEYGTFGLTWPTAEDIKVEVEINGANVRCYKIISQLDYYYSRYPILIGIVGMSILFLVLGMVAMIFNANIVFFILLGLTAAVWIPFPIAAMISCRELCCSFSIHRIDNNWVIHGVLIEHCSKIGFIPAKVCISYYQYGVLHRDHAAAVIHRDVNGNLILEEYYNNGNLDRKNGPARQEWTWFQPHNLRIKKYYSDGIEIDNPEPMTKSATKQTAQN
jgi:hypothetical protein